MVPIVNLGVRKRFDNSTLVIVDTAAQSRVAAICCCAYKRASSRLSKTNGASLPPDKYLPCALRIDIVLISKWKTAYCDSRIAGPQ